MCEKILETRLHLLDRGSYTNGRAVKILFGHSSVFKLYTCKFSDMVVVAAERKTGFGTFVYRKDISTTSSLELIYWTVDLKRSLF